MDLLLDVWRTLLLMAAFTQVGLIAQLARTRDRHPPITLWTLATWAVLVSYVFTSIATNYDKYLNWRCPLATLALTLSTVGLVEAHRSRRAT